MIVVTGATKSIGCSMIARLNAERFKDIISVSDSFALNASEGSEGKVSSKVSSADFLSWLDNHHKWVQIILDFDGEISFSKAIWGKCHQFGLPYIYAHAHQTLTGTMFDRWVLEQPVKPYFWAGLKNGSLAEAELVDCVYKLMLHRKDSGQYLLNTEGIAALNTIMNPQPSGQTK